MATKETKKIGVVAKNTQGYGYKYADLAQIHAYLEENGLRYTQYVETLTCGTELVDYIHTIIYEKDKDGAFQKVGDFRGCRVINASLSGKTNPAQEQGSGLTYARRYSLLMAFGLATDDDDAESLTAPKVAGNTTSRTQTYAGNSNRIDFATVRANIKTATTIEELKDAVKDVPEPLKKYFVDDYNKKVMEINPKGE